MITEISELATIQLQNQQRSTLRRTITLKDSRCITRSYLYLLFLSFSLLKSDIPIPQIHVFIKIIFPSVYSNYEMKLNLWGQRASEFDSDQICQLSQDHPVIVIFVGMLMKSYKGTIRFELLSALLILTNNSASSL